MRGPDLPIVASERVPAAVRPSQPWRAAALSLLRVGMVAAVVFCVHAGHQRRQMRQPAQPTINVPPELVREMFPAAASESVEGDGVLMVRDRDGQLLGALLQTSPQADRIIGFSGPTNVLLALDPGETIVAARILWSRDTREHAARVQEDPKFLPGYVGRTRREAASGRVDGVSGATLTSLAIAEGIAMRLGGRRESLRFPGPLTAADVRPLWPEASTVTADGRLAGLWRVAGTTGEAVGYVLSTSPAADNIVGYQGPTAALIGLRVRGPSPDLAASGATDPPDPELLEVTGIVLGRSYDNEPYVRYVREDRYYFRTFVGLTLADLAALDLQAEGVEGVSGATMTSLAVAEGLVAAAGAYRTEVAQLRAETAARVWRPAGRDLGTMVVTLLGVVIGLTRLRGWRRLRTAWLAVLVGYLGFVNGDLVSQALLAGWAQHGVPWRTMLGPLVLAGAALLLPVVSRRNIYCAQLCPHGAAQQLLQARLPWRIRLGRRLHRGLSLLPALLLLWVTAVAAGGWGFSLVDVEPFDAYVPAVAGWSALILFAMGLVVSLWVPMAYCQYGCPTGALLNYLRRQGRSDQLGWRDAVALMCLGLAIVLSR